MDRMTVQMEGFDELAMAFRKLGDPGGKERKVRAAERGAARIYMRAAKSKAVNALNDSGELSESIGWKHKGRSKGKYIDVIVGAKNRGKKGSSGSITGSWFTYSAIASIFNKGTGKRKTRRGKNTGQIKGTHFFDRAFLQTQGRVRRELKTRLARMMKREVAKTGMTLR